MKKKSLQDHNYTFHVLQLICLKFENRIFSPFQHNTAEMNKTLGFYNMKTKGLKEKGAEELAAGMVV